MCSSDLSPLATPGASGERRLALIEVRPIDAKRKLVLLRRDDREHLVLLGATGDLLIESGIEAPPSRPAEAAPPAAHSSGTPSATIGRLIAKLRTQPFLRAALPPPPPWPPPPTATSAPCHARR